MTEEAFRILTQGKVQSIIEANLEADPHAFALSQNTNEFPAAIVSTQLKYLQKSRRKLPRFFAARCIIPPLAYEQCSSEATAGMKALHGGRALDLTAGLGVDTLAFSDRFAEVVAVEADPVLAQVTRHNLALLGASNVRLHAGEAAAFVAQYAGPPFDLVYLDPSRRAGGQRVHALEAMQPDPVALLPALRRIARRLVIKLSPLLDLRALHQAFPGAGLEVLSVRHECREVLVHLPLAPDLPPPPGLTLRMWPDGPAPQVYTLPFPPLAPPLAAPPARPAWMWEPDIACYKAQCLPAFMHQAFPEAAGGLNDPMGYFLSPDAPPPDFPGRSFEVLDQQAFRPKVLQRWLKAHGIRQAHILRRAFPLTAAAIRERFRLAEGDPHYLIFTLLAGEKTVFLARRHDLSPPA